jgi:hypothetical protein
MNIPEIAFSRIAARVGAHFNPHEFNTHQSFLGKSSCGKSFLIRWGILPIAGPGRIVVIDVKPGGSRTWRGYGNEVTELKPGFTTGPDGTAHYHFLARNKTQTRRFLEMISDEGSCVIVLDDSRRVAEPDPNWGLKSQVDNLLTLGREIGITVLICANSTTWAPSGLKDQCGINWLGAMTNEEQRIKFAKIAGLPKESVPILGRLKPHEFLYSDQYSGDIRLALTRFDIEPPAESESPLRIVK